MAEVALNISRLTVNEKITKGRAADTAAGSTEGSAVLGVPAPAEVAALDTATDGLEAARDNKAAADNAAKLATQALADADDVFAKAMADYGRVVATKSGGLPAKITACGLDVAGTPGPIGDMVQVLNLVATLGDLIGEVDLMWEPVRGAKTYIIQFCEDPMNAANWQQFDLTTKSKGTVTGLVSGKKYWFRVCAKGTAPGQGPWSDPAMHMAA